MAIRLEVIQFFDDIEQSLVAADPAGGLGRHQARRPTDRPGEPGGDLLPRRQGAGHLRPGPAHADHGQRADPDAAADHPLGEVALPGPGLLHRQADVHRPEMGHAAADPSATPISAWSGCGASASTRSAWSIARVLLNTLVGTQGKYTTEEVTSYLQGPDRLAADRPAGHAQHQPARPAGEVRRDGRRARGRRWPRVRQVRPGAGRLLHQRHHAARGSAEGDRRPQRDGRGRRPERLHEVPGRQQHGQAGRAAAAAPRARWAWAWAPASA